MKKTIKNVGNLDLTKYSPQVLSSIKAIRTVGTVIIPSDASEEYYDAFSKIKIRDVGSIRKIPTDGKIIEINGFGELDKPPSDENSIIIVNGFCLARAFEAKNNIRLYVNGFIIYEKDAPIEILELNGLGVKIDKKLDDCKIYSNNLDIDRDYLISLEEKQCIVVGNKLKFKADVSLDLLKEKSPAFYVGNTVECNCSKEAIGWIKVNSRVGNKFEV